MNDKALPKKGDPDYEVYKKVKAWDVEMKCLPAWTEILELEYIRQSGRTNMFDLNGVVRAASDMGLIEAYSWIHRCVGNNYPVHKAYELGLKLHEPDHGPRAEWITREIKSAFIEREYKNREFNLKLELAKIDAEKKAALSKL